MYCANFYGVKKVEPHSIPDSPSFISPILHRANKSPKVHLKSFSISNLEETINWIASQLTWLETLSQP
jgi:hypothetical protein